VEVVLRPILTVVHLHVVNVLTELNGLSVIAVIVMKVPPRKGAPSRNGALMD
jgi:hypothetical protein